MITLRQNGSPNEKGKKTFFSKIARLSGRVFLGAENGVSFYFVAAVVVFVMLFEVTEIFSRFVLNYSFIGVVEIVELCVVVFVFASVSGVQRDKAHIRMDLLIDRLKAKRLGFIIECINRVLTLVVVLALSYLALVTFSVAYQTNMATWYLLLPCWPAMIFVPIGFFLLCIRLAIQIKEDLASIPRH